MNPDDEALEVVEETADIEVLPPGDTPGVDAGPQDKLALSGKKRKSWRLAQRRAAREAAEAAEVAGGVVAVEVVEGGLKKKRGGRPGRKGHFDTAEGREWQQRAFELYRDMGEERSAAKVARTLNLPERVVRGWATKFSWGQMIASGTPVTLQASNKVLQDRVAEKIVKAVERQVDLVNLRHSLMTVADPSNPEREMPTQDLSAYSLKETGAVLLSAVKTLAEALGLRKTEKEIEAVGTSGGGKGNKTGVMVNVIFKG